MQADGIVGTIGDKLRGGQTLDQAAGWCDVVLLAGVDREADRRSQRIYDDMQLAAEAAARSAESLGFSFPLFRRAPAARALARLSRTLAADAVIL